LLRSLGQTDNNSENDYNRMVDELLLPKVEDVRLIKRVYRKKESNDVAFPMVESKSESVVDEDNRLEHKFESSEGLYEPNVDIIDDTMQFSNIITNVDHGLFDFQKPDSPNFASFFKIRNVDDFFQRKPQINELNLIQDTQFDNIWSTNTTEYDFSM
jgi:hypothetical protein